MSGPATRVFVARLAGVVVFDPNGDQVGRVRDVIVMLRTGNQQPRVLGLVVEVPPRRAIFLPITRVTGIEAGAVMTTGTVSLRRFAKRDAETLVLGDLLDRKATLTETGEKVTVTDVAMEHTRTRDWLLTKVAVRADGRRVRRRGAIRVVDWDAVDGLSLHRTRPGRGEPAGRVRPAAPGRPRRRDARPLGQATGRGRRGARRRAAGRRPRRAVRR